MSARCGHGRTPTAHSLEADSPDLVRRIHAMLAEGRALIAIAAALAGRPDPAPAATATTPADSETGWAA